MIPFRRPEPLSPDALKRIRLAWLEGVSVDVIRARFGVSWRRLQAAVADLPKRTRPKRSTKRTTTRIPMDLT